MGRVGQFPLLLQGGHEAKSTTMMMLNLYYFVWQWFCAWRDFIIVVRPLIEPILGFFNGSTTLIYVLESFLDEPNLSHPLGILLALTHFLIGNTTLHELVQSAATTHYHLHADHMHEAHPLVAVDPYAGLGFWELRRQKKIERDLARQFGGGGGAGAGMWGEAALPEPGQGHYHTEGEYVDAKEMKRREKQRRKEDKEMEKLAKIQAKEEAKLARMEVEEQVKEAKWRAQQEAMKRREEEWHMQELLR